MTSIYLAAKFVDDKTISSLSFSKIGGVPVKRLAELELTFLDAITFKLFVDRNMFDAYAELIFLQNP